MGRKTPPPHEWGGDLSNYSFYSFALRTSRPAYWPQFGQMECGRRGCLQFGHGWIWTSASARCERRRPFLDLDSLTFGRATAREFYRTLALGRLLGGFLAVRRAGLQGLHPAPHRRHGAAEVRFELLQL